MSNHANTAAEPIQPSTTNPLPPAMTRQKSKAYTSTVAAQNDDQKYFTKYKELKQKVKEIETSNDQLQLKVLKAKKNIQRLRLERAILYERIEAIPPPKLTTQPRQGYPGAPLPHHPHHAENHASRHLSSSRPSSGYYESRQPLPAHLPPPPSHGHRSNPNDAPFHPSLHAQSSIRDSSPPPHSHAHDPPSGLGAMQLPKPPDVNVSREPYTSGSQRETPPRRFVVDDYSTGGSNGRSSRSEPGLGPLTERRRPEVDPSPFGAPPEGVNTSRHTSPFVRESSSSRMKHARSQSGENLGLAPAKRLKGTDEGSRGSPASLGHEGDDGRGSRPRSLRGEVASLRGESSRSASASAMEDVVVAEEPR